MSSLLPHHRRILIRTFGALCACLLAAFVAAGCGDDGGGSDGGDAGGVEGPLAWLPQSTWLIATADLDAERIDEALATLDRLPAWAFAEAYLPAKDGAGLRRELFEEVITSNGHNDGTPAKLSAKQMEAAFGDRAGLALTDTDFEALETMGPDAPFVLWFEVDDEEKALKAVRELADGKLSTAEHEGVEYTVGRDGGDVEQAFLARDGLLLLAPGAKQLERLIEVREGDDGLDDHDARAVMEAALDDTLAGVVVGTNPLLDAAPQLAEREGGMSAAQRDDLEQMLESRDVREAVPDWMGFSSDLDDVGLRFRGAWSNARPIADPEIGSRELTERMPADAPIINAGVADGDSLERMQAIWSEAREAWDLDLRDLAQDCTAEYAWACSLGIESAIALLEDEDLAELAKDAGPQAYAMAQRLSAPPAGRQPAAAQRSRSFELVTTGSGILGYSPPPELVRAAQTAGVDVAVVEAGDARTMRVRIRPGSPLARAIAREFDAASRAELRAAGLNLDQLLSPKGVTLSVEEVDDLFVTGYPQSAPSEAAKALRGEVDTVGENDRYRSVVKAADPPKQVGSYGWVDLRSFVDSVFDAVAAGNPEALRVKPVVENNLTDVPGALSWTTRQEVGDEQVGVAEWVLPILE